MITDAPANAAAAPDTGLRVGDWQLDAQANTLTRDGGAAVHLEPKAIEVLALLCRRAGEVVAREELLAAVWPGVVVGDDTLTQAVIKLRKALGDDARRPRYIETISKRGYRLIAAVAARGAAPELLPPAAPARRWRRWGAASLALAMLAAMALLWRNHEPPATTDTARPIVAVLPLANQSGDAKRDYFSDGLTQDLINALGLYSGLRVISHHSLERYKAQPVNPQALRSELGARYIVQGSVREADGKLRVSVTLSDADSGVVLWSDRHEGDANDVFALQDRIVKNVVGTLAVKVTRREEQSALIKPPGNLQAYDLVLRARALVTDSNRVANRQARALLAQALELAPEYAEALLVLSMAEVQRSLDFGWTEDPAQSVERAEQYARRALAAGDTGVQSRAHGELGVIYAAQSNFEQALAEVDRAAELNPSDARAFDTRGFVLVWLGRTEEALAAFETAERFDPLGRSAGAVFSRALAFYTLRRYRESLAVSDAALQRFPQTSFLHAIRAAALAQSGELDAAHAAAAETLRLEPFFHAKSFGDRFVDPKLMAHLQEGLRGAGL